MFDRLGENARNAVSMASEEAYGLGHRHIGTEHLLLGIGGQRGTAAADALIAAGAPLVSVREKVVEALASRTAPLPLGGPEDLKFTARASRALDRANRLSLRVGSELVECEHILLSVLDVEGTAGQVLRGLGVDPDTVRHALESPGRFVAPGGRSEASGGGAKPAGKAAVQGPLCGTCGASIEKSLARTTVTMEAGEAFTEADVFYCSDCGTAITVCRRPIGEGD